MGAIPEFPKKLAYKVSPIRKNNFRIVQWTEHGCTVIKEKPGDKDFKPLGDFQTVIDSLRSAIEITYCDQVVGIINHKLTTVTRCYGAKPRERRQ